jgi:hypothetical protein
MNRSFAGSMPELYDRVLVPVMFEPFGQLRVLKPGSGFLFSVWGRREGSVWEVATNVVGEFLSRDPASLVSPPYNDVAVVRTELSAAGFREVAVEEVTKLLHASSAREAAVTLCHGGLVRAAIEAQMPSRLDDITEAATTAIAARFGSGPIESPLRALLFTAVRPMA